MEEEFATIWICLSIITTILAPLLILGCGKKKPNNPNAAVVAPMTPPMMSQKACNSKSGLLPDDVDLRSGFKKPGAPGAPPPSTSPAPTASPDNNNNKPGDASPVAGTPPPSSSAIQSSAANSNRAPTSNRTAVPPSTIPAPA